MGQVDRIRRALDSCRSRPSNVTGDELARIAARLGRTRISGTHPTYVKPGRPPIQIPAHSSGQGQTLKIKTAKNILSVLEADLDDFDQDAVPVPEEPEDD